MNNSVRFREKISVFNVFVRKLTLQFRLVEDELLYIL